MTNHPKIYIHAAQQVSIQQPLSEQWMKEPLRYEDSFVKAVNPPFREYIPANEVRRMGNIMKRALVTALKVLGDTGTEHPDAIITGTSIGCLDYTERFLDALTENGEQMLSPTYFMQSTHNTVSSALAIYTKTHGYNTTYSHGEMSFDLAVLDAWMQLRLGKISNALVGGHDEMVESYFKLLCKTGYVGRPGMVACGEVAMSMLMGTGKRHESLCELSGIVVGQYADQGQLKESLERMLAENGLTPNDISAVMTGANGNPAHDRYDRQILETLFPTRAWLRYKHIFGENFTSSALGFYAAAHCLAKGSIPTFLHEEDSPCLCREARHILLLNRREEREVSLILLSRL